MVNHLLCNACVELTFLIGDFANERLQSPDTYRRMISKGSKITKKYDICQNGCSLFGVEQAEVKECDVCKQPRYKNQDQVNADINNTDRNPLMPFVEPVPNRQISYTSVFSALTELYADDEKLDVLTYGQEFLVNEPTTNYDYKDIFSGSNYKSLVQRTTINANTICLVLFVDGYQNKNSQRSNQVMINCLVMNIHPEHR